MDSPVRIFSDRSHYGRQDREHLSDLLRPYWKEGPFSDEDRKRTYGLSLQDFSLVDELADAELAVLPMTWNLYRMRGDLERVQAFVRAATQSGCPVLSYVSGDEGVKIPRGFDHVHVARASGFRSRRRPNQTALPIFIGDPITRYPEVGNVHSDSRDRSLVEISSAELSSARAGLPTIGFCGQASESLLKMALDVVRTSWRNGLHHLGWRLREPQPLTPTALLRARAMRCLVRSPRVQTRFIVRHRYRGGAADKCDRERLSREFYQNIAETDYTLCVRGGGNFSKRFYETLAMGRIPILLDTDCLLPFEEDLNWNEYIVRVPQRELQTLPEVVAGHYAALGRDGVVEMKRRCRMLWEDWLTFGGFHRHLANRILGRSVADPI